jgi:hypothetical protein
MKYKYSINELIEELKKLDILNPDKDYNIVYKDENPLDIDIDTINGYFEFEIKEDTNEL